MPEIPIIGSTKPKQEKVTLLQCPQCKSLYFDTVNKVQVISPLVTQSGRQEIRLMPVFRCAVCKKIIDQSGE